MLHLVLKRIDKFKQELDSLITKYSDLSYEELADSLEYLLMNIKKRSSVG